MTKLNIPNNKEEKFEVVSFVNDMSHYSLKILVKRLWENLHILANSLENNRKDITQIIDQMLSGERWTPKTIQHRYSFTIHNGEIIQYDSGNNEFNTLKVIDGKWVKSLPSKAMTYDELTNLIKRNK